MNLNKNEILTIEPYSINDRAESVTKIDGIKVICPGLLPGEKAEVKIIKSGKNIAFARIVRIISADKDRVISKCKNSNCKICELIFASYERQVKIKKDSISTLYGLDIAVEPSIQFGYRNKAVLPVAKVKDQVLIGTYRQNSHDITDWAYACPVLSEEMNNIISTVKTMLFDVPEDRMPVQIYIRGGKDFYQTGFIVEKTSGDTERVLKDLMKKMPEVRSVFISIAEGTNSVLIKDPVFVEGEDHCLLNTSYGEYKVSPSSFFQANIHILNKILKKIEKILLSKPDQKVLDLYSGCGVLSNFEGVQRTCVESNASSFGFAVENEVSRFIAADTLSVISEIINGKFNIIIADPPRKGIDPETLKAIDSSSAETFIYLSCDPKTQKRDINMLGNFDISEITAYDMFPNTVHIESLAILKRKGL